MIAKGSFSPTLSGRPLGHRPSIPNALVLIAFAIFIIFVTFRVDSSPRNPIKDISRLPTITSHSSSSSSSRPDYAQAPRIAKVSMLYGGNDAPHHYLRALRSHRAHNERFNYAMYTLQEDAIDGYWNKPTYLLSLIMQELAKPAAERLEWLMWIDADLVLVNPSIPLETFLPPEKLSHIHFLGNRDQNGLNTGTFFLRVHPWSIKFLTKALATPLFTPEKLGWHPDQEAMSLVLKDDELSSGAQVLFQPRTWYNAYQTDMGIYEGGDPTNGHMLVHFPGLGEKRWPMMEEWLDRIEKSQGKFDVPLNESVYVDQVFEFWELQSQALHALKMAARLANKPDGERPPVEEMEVVEEKRGKLVELVKGPDVSTGPGTDLVGMLKEGVEGLFEALEVAEGAVGKEKERMAKAEAEAEKEAETKTDKVEGEGERSQQVAEKSAGNAAPESTAEGGEMKKEEARLEAASSDEHPARETAKEHNKARHER